MSEHTPGPWWWRPAWHRTDVFFVNTGSENGLPDDPPGIATVNLAADARLIAAAPDLLRALEAMHNSYHGTDEGVSSCVFADAIAKASGTSLERAYRSRG